MRALLERARQRVAPVAYPMTRFFWRARPGLGLGTLNLFQVIGASRGRVGEDNQETFSTTVFLGTLSSEATAPHLGRAAGAKPMARDSASGGGQSSGVESGGSSARWFEHEDWEGANALRASVKTLALSLGTHIHAAQRRTHLSSGNGAGVDSEDEDGDEVGLARYCPPRHRHTY